MGWIQEGMISIGRKNSDKNIIGMKIIMVTAEAERLVFTKLAITKEREREKCEKTEQNYDKDM